MGQIIETKINRFDGGISDDPREPSLNKCALVKHFDIFSNPYRLTPYRSTEADTATSVSSTDLEQYTVQDFQLGLDGKLYGLGRVSSGSVFPKVFSKADPTTGNWTVEATAEGTGALIRGCFIEWQSRWWMFSGTTNISRWVIGGTFTNAQGTVATITSVAQGVIGQDNNLYLPYNNKLARVTSSDVVSDNVAPAIPSDMRITSVCRYGTYLAIGCAYGTSNITIPSGRSQVFIWDMVSTTFTDIIDWGEGALRILDNVEGRVVGVTDKFLSSTLGLGRGSMVVRMWAGGIPQVVKEVVANQTVTADATAFPSTVTRFPRSKVVKNNKLYWVASVPLGLSTATESTFHLGIWVFGRKNVNSDFALAVDYVEEAVDTSNFFINSFGAAGDFFFISHSAISAGKVTKVDDASNFTITSIYDTQIFNAGDVASLKDLVDITCTTVPLPSAGQVVVRYRTDAQSSYTTIFTNTTDNSISRTLNLIASSGAALPKNYREIQFRIQSTGGAEITGISFREDIIGRKYITD